MDLYEQFIAYIFQAFGLNQLFGLLELADTFFGFIRLLFKIAPLLIIIQLAIIYLVPKLIKKLLKKAPVE